MKKKIVILSTIDSFTQKLAVEHLKELNIEVIETGHDDQYDLYNIYTNVTIEQAYQLLDYAFTIGAILRKGEA